MKYIRRRYWPLSCYPAIIQSYRIDRFLHLAQHRPSFPVSLYKLTIVDQRSQKERRIQQITTFNLLEEIGSASTEFNG